MRLLSRMRRSVFVLCLLVVAVPVLAQTPQEVKQQPFQPQVGQGGKDVVWVPTPQALVDKMLDMAQVTPQDFVMDLGSGDGRTVITAAKRGARAMGIEYNPDMVELSKQNAAKAGVSDRAEFMKADLFETDLSKATVITLFLLPDINLEAAPEDPRSRSRARASCRTPSRWKTGPRTRRPRSTGTARPGAPRCSGSSRRRRRASGRGPAPS